MRTVCSLLTCSTQARTVTAFPLTVRVATEQDRITGLHGQRTRPFTDKQFQLARASTFTKAIGSRCRRKACVKLVAGRHACFLDD